MFTCSQPHFGALYAEFQIMILFTWVIILNNLTTYQLLLCALYKKENLLHKFMLSNSTNVQALRYTLTTFYTY